jgi:hypothetical protein
MQLTTKTKIQIVISGIIIIFALVIAGSSFSSLTTPSPKLVQLQKDLDNASLNMVDLCMEVVSISDLTHCKQSIQEIKDNCKDSSYSSFSVCSDPRLDQFFISVDDRIAESQNNIIKAEQKVNDKSLDLVNLCYVSNDPGCEVSMLMIKEQCNEPSLSLLSVCDDPRVDEILARTQPSTPGYSNQNIEQPIENPKLDRECQPNRLCVKPGDYLRYSFESPYIDGKGNLTYYIKNYIDADNISVQLVYVSEQGKKYEKNRTLNLVTGLLNKDQPSSDEFVVSHNTIPYALFNISPVDLSYEELNDVEITEGKRSGWYGSNYERDTVFFRTEDSGSVDVFVDKETRVIILLAYYQYGGYLVQHNVLTDTNIFPK